MRLLASLIAGMTFGAGLTVSRMVDPSKILDFLDISGISRGRWDPTLAMVFIGALSTMFLAHAFARRLRRPLLGVAFPVGSLDKVDGRLMIGASIFGVGWGMAGVCPGPALAAIAIAGDRIGELALFVVAMLAGIAFSRLVTPSPTRPSPPATEARS